nr:hypothetical protein RKHAN_01909 [Rhizobium sp. Khangiran2]
MMIRSFTKSAALAVVLLSSVAVGSHLPGFTDTVWAKGGDGGGNGGGNGGGGNNGGGNGGGNGNGGGHGQGSDRSSDRSDAGKASARDLAPGQSEKGASRRADKREEEASVSRSELKGLNSLNRNYHAYLNSNDPRMEAVSTYAMDYAQFEIDNGVSPSETDAILGDEALRDALSAFTDDPVSDEMLEEAKAVLGVGTADGKIDEIRSELER